LTWKREEVIKDIVTAPRGLTQQEIRETEKLFNLLLN
jgi:hypothetical protein